MQGEPPNESNYFFCRLLIIFLFRLLCSECCVGFLSSQLNFEVTNNIFLNRLWQISAISTNASTATWLSLALEIGRDQISTRFGRYKEGRLIFSPFSGRPTQGKPICRLRRQSTDVLPAMSTLSPKKDFQST